MQCKLNAMQAKETAGQVGLTHAPSGPLSFSATASRCEAAGAGAHKKMSAVLKLESNGAPLTIALPNVQEDAHRVNGHESSEAAVSFSKPTVKHTVKIPVYHKDSFVLLILSCNGVSGF